jgi:ribosomal protein S21
MMGTLTQRFRTTATVKAPLTQWVRNMSSTNPTQPNNSDDKTPTLPGVLASRLQEPRELSYSLDAYAGRSIGNVSNPKAAYRRLGNILYQNSVRREIRANMNYEKPTVARRRKNIERNRKLFGAMVRKKVALIMQMKQRYAIKRSNLSGLLNSVFLSIGVCKISALAMHPHRLSTHQPPHLTYLLCIVSSPLPLCTTS